MKLRQIDLPDDVRAKFPASLGTLKQIKVLTNNEHNGRPRKERYIPSENDKGFKDYKIRQAYAAGLLHRATCYFCLFDRGIAFQHNYYEDFRHRPWRCLKHLIKASPLMCSECPETKTKSRYQVNIGIAPIDTENIELPSIHYKKPRRVKND
jgi:hypothetical protein